MNLKSRKSHESKSSFRCLGFARQGAAEQGRRRQQNSDYPAGNPAISIAETGGFASPPRGGFAKETQAKAKL